MRTAGKQSLLLLLFYIFILYYILHHITHLVNHQKVILERKPAVISGQAFWKSNKNTTGTLVCSSDLSMTFLMFKDPHNPQFMALNHSFIQSCILKAWHLPLALDNTHTHLQDLWPRWRREEAFHWSMTGWVEAGWGRSKCRTWWTSACLQPHSENRERCFIK